MTVSRNDRPDREWTGVPPPARCRSRVVRARFASVRRTRVRATSGRDRSLASALSFRASTAIRMSVSDAGIDQSTLSVSMAIGVPRIRDELACSDGKILANSDRAGFPAHSWAAAFPADDAGERQAGSCKAYVSRVRKNDLVGAAGPAGQLGRRSAGRSQAHSGRRAVSRDSLRSRRSSQGRHRGANGSARGRASPMKPSHS